MPAPNGTIGVPWARQMRDHRRRFLGVARIDDDVGRGRRVPALVGAVPAAIVLAGDDALASSAAIRSSCKPIRAPYENVTTKRSAGILLFRRADGLEVLLVHPGGPFWAKKDLGAWSIPKGEHDDAEEGRACAIREFTEETGSEPGPGELTSWGRSSRRRARSCRRGRSRAISTREAQSNTFTMQWPPRSGRMQEFPEVDRAEWFSLDAAASESTLHKPRFSTG